MTTLCALAFSCGVILLYRLSVLPVSWWLPAVPVTAFYTVLVLKSPVPRKLVLVAAALLSGLGWAAWHAGDRLGQRLPSELERVPLVVEGYVCDIPAPGSFNSLRFSFCVTGWPGMPESDLPRRLRLSWYGGDAQMLQRHRLSLTVLLKRPHGNLNPSGFRYETWLFGKGFRATGSVRAAEPAGSLPCQLYCHFTATHQAIARWVSSRFSGASHYPLIASLMIGNRGAMESRHWEVLKATGTVHLVAISGLHLGLVAMGAGFVARRTMIAVPGHRLSEASLRWSVFAVIGASCVAYALVSGFTVPTRRALIMVVIATWALVCGREVSPWGSLALALATVLLFDPLAPLDQGFWLSFTAVAILLTTFAGRLGASGWFSGLLLAQLAVFIGLWPVLAQFGQGQPVAGLMANLIAIPWVSVVIMPIIIIGGIAAALVPDAADLMIPLMDAVLGVLWWFLIRLSEWQMSVTAISAAPLVLGAASGLLALRLPLPWFPALVSFGLILWLLPEPKPGTDAVNREVAVPEMRILDVGQGLSVLVRHGRDVLLYDTGPAVPGVFSAVESTILPNLRDLGVRRIDHLVISHGDRDHAGGVGLLVRSLPVGRVIAGEPDALRDGEVPAEVPVDVCRPDQRMLGELELVFWRSPGAVAGNDASCVLLVRHRVTGVEWILPGDITEEIETAFLGSPELATTRPGDRVVVAPHHGSKTSSSERWVDTLSPDLVIYTAGYRHRYGHPHPDVVARYGKIGAVAMNTACSGGIILNSTPDGLVVNEMRHDSPFWIGGKGLARDQCKIP
ncbi:DNA internalization-related competence protein ComEC/Rec2 [Marinobacter sp. C7]|uniref:DNA internalization-related competence protein ComEC/Rec2 n=1 Tax=Marinobacter sp. C7 TaxID=2951363 RepID=UPI002551FC64|nr:DNA internalization-related competence protein ComEC/Rec2 [Marinobacter sp. C7]